jgi:hypothetical protein
MTLSATQMAILTAAAQQSERLVLPPAKLAPAPREAIRRSLLGKGVIEPVDLRDAEAGAAWAADGTLLTYRITAAGLAAIRAEARREADMPPEAPAESAQGAQGAAGSRLAETPPEPLAGPPESNTRLPAAQPRHALLAAAQAVLAAWDDEAGQRDRLPDAVGNLRAALAGKSAPVPRDPAAPRQPREGTKQQTVLALLRRPEGVTVAQIAEATGWQAHTVRGFFAGLKKRQDITVEAIERIRQVGPNRDGAKGSYSVYRTADAG